MCITYHPDLEKAITSLKGRLCSTSSTKCEATFHSILAVGATRSPNNPSVLSIEDTRHTYSALLHLEILGIRLSDRFSHTTMNLINGDEQDFLKNPQRNDVLMLCHIPHTVDGISTDGKTGLKISDHHFNRAAWQGAAQKSGSKIVMFFGGENEINPSHFVDLHSHFIEVPARVLKDCYQAFYPHGHYHSPTSIVLDKTFARAFIRDNTAAQPLSTFLNIYLK